MSRQEFTWSWHWGNAPNGTPLMVIDEPVTEIIDTTGVVVESPQSDSQEGTASDTETQST